ncbi:uncharacterized protein LACBIDRAFT_300010 [Laccaria bicolor S238N-H82]|uniref:Predicted protein n=1 Tax=Laccaria bicolor (strain S238N-H82 / ATCC MYA-4686) TaxID=486041 RepID=B0DFU9_LACBS|nr:uncharacterized protein LACBIDRAFT_300010 [Laccaria bicolor S238N-H82]EDR06407.1 predicted protein [Laccaria bicolor S238N-H82]|eukprot:XP_001882779.1 predicted protein [Laccaria bicolor S238N-H82]
MAPIPEEMIITARDSVLKMVNNTRHKTEIEIAWRRLHPMQQEIMMKKIVNRLTPELFDVPVESVVKSRILASWIADMMQVMRALKKSGSGSLRKAVLTSATCNRDSLQSEADEMSKTTT